MVRLGNALRERLESEGFRIVNRTPLPVICLQDARHEAGGTFAYLKDLSDRVVASGTAWVSMVALGSRVPAIRACITSFRTRESDLDALVESLVRFRPPS
jgi:hypothetical protein